MNRILIIFLLSLQFCSFATAEKSIYSQWRNGPSTQKDYFPIGVWLQSPERAQQYKDIGINTYVGLYRNPTIKHLKALDQAGMKLLCRQNKTALENLDDYSHIIIGWTQMDEPDNANEQVMARFFGQPVKPEIIQKNYSSIIEKDPTRPVFLNLGQGIAWDNWKGRGTRNNKPQDYPEYIKGCDIISFDIYPMAHKDSDVNGKLWYLAKGLENIKKHSDSDKIIWNFVEASKVKNKKSKLTPQLLRSQVWISIIHGSKGIVYFVHQWSPKLNEASIFSNKELLSAVRDINYEITELAPILNSPNISPDNDRLVVKSSNEDSKISVMHKRIDGVSYIFAVEMRGLQTKATFDFKNLKSDYIAKSIDQNRSLPINAGKFSVWFDPWQVRMYKIISPVHDKFDRRETTTIAPFKRTRK